MIVKEGEFLFCDINVFFGCFSFLFSKHFKRGVSLIYEALRTALLERTLSEVPTNAPNAGMERPVTPALLDAGPAQHVEQESTKSQTARQAPRHSAAIVPRTPSPSLAPPTSTAAKIVPMEVTPNLAQAIVKTASQERTMTRTTMSATHARKASSRILELTRSKTASPAMTDSSPTTLLVLVSVLLVQLGSLPTPPKPPVSPARPAPSVALPPKSATLVRKENLPSVSTTPAASSVTTRTS